MLSSVELICVDPRRVQEIWSDVSPLLQAACRRTTLTAFADIEADILAGRSLLWIAWNGHAIEAAAATVLINSEDGKVCVITVCGGRGMRRWLPLARQIENYARDEGCVSVRIFGRRGWLRALEGYKQRYVIMEKEMHGRGLAASVGSTTERL